MLAIVSVINQKGGVAKTTTSLNVAAGWAKEGKKVLLVDLDPQSSATKAIFGDREFEKTIYDVIVAGTSIQDIIVHSENFGIDVAPAEILLSGIDIQLAAHFGRETILRKKLEPIARKYDAVLIDCSPSLGLMTINALMASKDIIIPICPEYFSLKGIELILDTLANIRTGLGYKVGVRGVVITRFRDRRVARNVIQEVEEKYGLKVFEHYIPDSIAVEEAHHRHLPVLAYAPRNPAAKAYTDLAREMW
ncbi:MAG: ParA family protein [Bdellovibrionaceae bacterium]|nr:ParA family protein [Pseudobdellovibrionaceae bacterium]